MEKHRNILYWPLSVIYGTITGLRNFFYNSGIFKSIEFRIPVICVGNITVGGTGKTPHTEYLAGILSEHFKVATLSRGYKRKTHGFLIANPSSGVNDIGDEPKQISLKFSSVLVAVDNNRVEGVKKIIASNNGTEVIILDDGFQHRKIKPGFSILLTDFERLMIRDHMLPYGNLREGIHNMRRADIIIITKTPDNITPMQRRLIVKEVNKAPYQNLYFTSFVYKTPKAIFKDLGIERAFPAKIEKETSGAILVTGIANPLPLKEKIGDIFEELTHLTFPDHYNFREKDINTISEAFNNLKSPFKYIITTEKDAVRLREFTNIADPVRSALYYMPIAISFQNSDKEEFDNIIINYVRKNKGINRIPKVKGNH